MKFSKLNRAIFIILAFVLAVVTPLNAEVITNGYSVNNKNYDLIKGVFSFPSVVTIDGKIQDIPARFFYSDGFFAETPNNYNAHLATASLCMAMAGFYSNEGETGPKADYSNKSKNIVKYMQDIGVNSNDIFRNFYNLIRPQIDSIGVTIGKKTQTQNNNRTLIIISIRGSNYEKEWASNFTLGSNDEAEGFAKAANMVFASIKEYIKTKNLNNEISNGNIDFWIAGYSRAGATTNLTARRLVDEYASKNNKIFAYCIEAPQGGLTSSNTAYNCIHSVINKNDLVPYVAPAQMSFKRYGIDHYIPGSNANYNTTSSDNTFYQDLSSQEYLNMKNKMLTQLKAVNPYITFNDNFTSYGLDTRVKSMFRGNFIQTGSFLRMNDFLDGFIQRLSDWTKLDRSKYTKDIQPTIRDYMAVIYDSTNSEINEFLKRIKKLNNKMELAKIVRQVWTSLGKWDKTNFKYRKQTITKIVRWLEDSECFEALNLTFAERQKLLMIDLPPLIDFLMTFISVDYNNNLYNTRGLTQILTFLLNRSNISMNHYPEVTLAWLRAHDSLYDNETTRVSFVMNPNEIKISTALKTSENENENESEQIIGVAEIPYIFLERGTDPKSALPTTVTAGTINGNIKELPITWNTNPEWYSYQDDDWKKIDDLESELTEPYTIRGVFNGKITGAKFFEDVSSDVTAEIYIAGVPRLEPPYASLPDGEYDGPQQVTLSHVNANNENIIYTLAYGVEGDDGSYEGGGDFPLTYNGTITIGEKNATETKEYALVAYVESANTNVSADSEQLIWYYTINPVNSEDVNSEYVNNTLSKTFTLSKDVAVMWRINYENLTFTASDSNTTENPEESIFIEIAPSDADNNKITKADVTIVTIAGTTRKGIYNIPVQISNDNGTTWTDEKIITFDTSEVTNEKKTQPENKSETQRKILRSSSSGCNSGVAACSLGIALMALMLKRNSK